MKTTRTLHPWSLFFLVLYSLFDAASAHGQDFVKRITPPVGSRHGWFGYSLVVDGNTLVTGDPEYRKSSAAEFCPIGYGAVQIYKKTGSTWSSSPSQSLFHDTGSNENKFGRYVALKNNVLVVSSERDAYVSGGITNPQAGAFKVFRRTTTSANFTQLAKVYAPNAGNSARFTEETGVVTNGTYIAAGSSGGGSDVYVYQIQGNSVVLVSTITPAFNVHARRLFITDTNVLVLLPSQGSWAVPLAYQLNGTQATRFDTASLEGGDFKVGGVMAGDGNTVVYTKNRPGTGAPFAIQIVKFSTNSIQSSEVLELPLVYSLMSPRQYEPTSVAIKENQGFLMSMLAGTTFQRFVLAYKYFNDRYNYAGAIRHGNTLTYPASSDPAISVALTPTEMFLGDRDYVNTGAGANPCSSPANMGGIAILEPLATVSTGPEGIGKLQPTLNSTLYESATVVATDGANYIAVGASSDEDGPQMYGQVTLFRNWSGQWQQVERYIDGYNGWDNTTPGPTGFGSALDMNESFLAIGAPSGYSSISQVRSGEVVVARKINDHFVHGPSLTRVAPLGSVAAGSQFGSSLALSGNTLVVGAPSAIVSQGSNRGFAAVYDWDGTNWTFYRTLTSSAASGQDWEGFGYKVAASGSYVIVGIPYRESNDRFDAGAVQIFRRTSTGYVSAGTFNAPSVLGSNAYFGSEVTIGADYAAASSLFGTVVVYKRSGTSWTTDQVITPSPGEMTFGSGLAIEGNHLVAGAFSFNTVYRYERGASWTRTGTLAGPTNTVGYGFGNAIDIKNDFVVIGDYSSLAGNNNAPTGAAYFLNFFGI